MTIHFSRLKSHINRSIAGVLAAVLLAGVSSPIVVFAEDTSPSSHATTSKTNSDAKAAPAASPDQSTSANDTASTTQPSAEASPPAATAPATQSDKSSAAPAKSSGKSSDQAQPGPKKPTGADASTYTYNASTGLWENDHYTWNPNTGVTSPKKAATYSYNPSTGMWDTTQWKYDAPSGAYVPNVVEVPASQVPATSKSTAGQPSSSISQSTKTAGNNGGNSLSTTNANSGQFNNFYNAAISNKLDSVAISGNAIVSNNTSASNAASGDAANNANLLNMLQSTANIMGGNAQTFVSNIYGDVQGDLLLDPASLSQPSSSAASLDNNFKLNQKNTGSINNDITLASTTGDATVTHNTTGGDATTGNASAVANIVNMMNSMVTANQSFMGVVNIYGNLNGNIVMPQSFLDQLLATNAPTSTIDTSAINQFSSNVNNSQMINNQVDTAAASGNATVDHNTTAGSATTGTASNKVTVFNLTGSQFIGTNTMLVFVNVMGQWVGVMMNAPSGSTAAAYGSGVTGDTGTTTANATNTTDATVGNKQTINNNIKASAQSGNAAVMGNTTAGNAKSGNASTGVNLLNLTNDKFSLSNWFGVLFINVFGNWYGDFGVSKPVLASTDGATSADTATAQTANTNSGAANQNVQVFRFVPNSSGSGQVATTTSSALSPNNFQLVSAKLAATPKAAASTKAVIAKADDQKQGLQAIQVVGIVVFAGGLGLFVTEQHMRARAARRS